MLTIIQVITWAATGLIAGSLVGAVAAASSRGLGRTRNLLLGMAGALVGGFLVRLLDLFPSLDEASISARDLLAAVIGAGLLLLAFWFLKRSRKPPAYSPADRN